MTAPANDPAPKDGKAAGAGPAEGTPPRAVRRLDVLLPLVAFALGFVALFQPMLGASWRETVPVNVARGVVEDRAYPKPLADETDHQFVVWLTARNARTLVSAPHRYFEAEPCHPTEKALALGEPAVSVGITGILPWLVTRDPIATYNVVLVLVCVVSFAAMFLLVREWTGSAAAASLAALLYAFHEIKIKDSVHFFAWDGSWTVLALYFTSRLFRRGRWSDAVGLALSIAMQIGGSVYPLLTAVLVAPVVLFWLALYHGVRGLRPAQLGFVVMSMLVVAILIFAPYLSKSETGVLAERGYQVFLDFRWLLPGGPGFLGWVLLALALAAFALPRRLRVGEGRPDPRWAMLVAALLLVSIASGGNMVARLEALQRGEPLPPQLPNLYEALAAVLPGLKQIRGPAALFSGTHLAFCVLAGLGAAGLLRGLPARARPAAAGALLLVAWIELMRPAALGLDPRIRYRPVSLRPPAEELAFHRELRAVGSTGPLLELPFDPKSLRQASRAVLLSAWHRRRTAQCYNSYIPPEVDAVKAVADRLPEPDAIRELAALGFTTILVHTDPAYPGRGHPPRSWTQVLDGAADGVSLVRVARDERLTAYEIVSGGAQDADAASQAAASPD